MSDPDGAGAGASRRWVRALLGQVERFAQAREVLDPVVRISLSDDERFFLYVPLSSIAKVELMTRPPRGTRALVGLRLSSG
jgi:hypothetical protein